MKKGCNIFAHLWAYFSALQFGKPCWKFFSKLENHEPYIVRNLIGISDMGLYRKMRAWWEKMIRYKNFHFCSNFMVVTFLEYRRPKRMLQEGSHLTDSSKNQKNHVFWTYKLQYDSNFYFWHSKWRRILICIFPQPKTEAKTEAGSSWSQKTLSKIE